MVNHAFASWREREQLATAPPGSGPARAPSRRLSDPLASHIERYLFDRADWVSTEELCSVFALVGDRRLRAAGDKPGLCSSFAISGDQGFKHVALATTKEYLDAKHRLRKHAIAELVRARDLDRSRRHATVELSRPAISFEKDTGQALLGIS